MCKASLVRRAGHPGGAGKGPVWKGHQQRGGNKQMSRERKQSEITKSLIWNLDLRPSSWGVVVREF